MFKVFQSSVIDDDALVQNLSETVIGVLADDGSLNIDKFKASSYFSAFISDQDAFQKLFMKEKLAFLTACALISLEQTVHTPELQPQLVDTVTQKLAQFDDSDIKTLATNLQSTAPRYAAIWKENSPRQAGELLEAAFVIAVFGSKPDVNNVDAKYILYKQLSSLQRKYLLASAVAVRNSKVPA